jgi:hypothetical protein
MQNEKKDRDLPLHMRGIKKEKIVEKKEKTFLKKRQGKLVATHKIAQQNSHSHGHGNG